MSLARELYGVRVLASRVASAVQADIARECGVDWLEGPYCSERSQAVDPHYSTPPVPRMAAQLAWAV